MSENHEIARLLEGHTEMITRQFKDLKQEVREVKQSQETLRTAIQGDLAGDKLGIKDKADRAYQGVVSLNTRMDGVEKEVTGIRNDRSRRFHIGYGIVIGVGLVFPKVWALAKEHLKVVLALCGGGVLLMVAILLQRSL